MIQNLLAAMLLISEPSASAHLLDLQVFGSQARAAQVGRTQTSVVFSCHLASEPSLMSSATEGDLIFYATEENGENLGIIMAERNLVEKFLGDDYASVSWVSISRENDAFEVSVPPFFGGSAQRRLSGNYVPVEVTCDAKERLVCPQSNVSGWRLAEIFDHNGETNHQREFQRWIATNINDGDNRSKPGPLACGKVGLTQLVGFGHSAGDVAHFSSCPRRFSDMVQRSFDGFLLAGDRAQGGPPEQSGENPKSAGRNEQATGKRGQEQRVAIQGTFGFPPGEIKALLCAAGLGGLISIAAFCLAMATISVEPKRRQQDRKDNETG